EPRELIRGDERRPFVVRLEHLATLVEEVAPRRSVLRDARVEHEVVAAPGHGDRVELDRAEPPEHLEHRFRPALKRTCGCEQLAPDEETTGGLGGDLQGTGRYRELGRQPSPVSAVPADDAEDVRELVGPDAETG